jgi:hypothetical protein
MAFHRCRAAPLLWLLPLLPAVCRAQPDDSEAIHWAYSAYFGTGAYTVGDAQQTYVFSAGPRWKWRDAQLDDEARRAGFEFRLPVAIGAYSFDAGDLGSTLHFDNVATISAVPGVTVELPINTRWSIKALTHLGWGTELDGESSAWIYWAGIRSEARFHAQSFDWALVNALTYVGYSATSTHSGLVPLFTAFEFDHPLERRKIAGEPVHIHWHVAFTKYLNAIDFGLVEPSGPTIRVDDEWELGVAFGTGAEPLRLWRLRWDRVGIAYRFSSGGEFEGIGLVFRSLFDR